MILRGDLRKRIRLVAVFLIVLLRDLPKDTGEAAFDLGIFLQVAGLHQDTANIRARRIRHLLDADHQNDLALLGFEKVEPLINGSRSRCTGILDTRCRLKAEPLISLQDKR